MSEEIDITIYSEEQRWWNNIVENCETTIKQFHDTIKLQEAIKTMAEGKIEELKE